MDKQESKPAGNEPVRKHKRVEVTEGEYGIKIMIRNVKPASFSLNYR